MSEGINNIKIVSDGTTNGTKVTLADGTTVGTISRITFIIDANKAMGKAIIECLVPDVELELLPENVEWKVASIKRCDKCGGITKPEIFTDVDKGRFVRYTCTLCEHQMEYPFKHQWDTEHPEIDINALNQSLEEADANGGK